MSRPPPGISRASAATASPISANTIEVSAKACPMPSTSAAKKTTPATATPSALPSATSRVRLAGAGRSIQSLLHGETSRVAPAAALVERPGRGRCSPQTGIDRTVRPTHRCPAGCGPWPPNDGKWALSNISSRVNAIPRHTGAVILCTDATRCPLGERGVRLDSRGAPLLPAQRLPRAGVLTRSQPGRTFDAPVAIGSSRCVNLPR